MMTMLLGGRAAEQLVFGSVTNGATDDLRRVAEIAYSMIHDYAMGTGFASLRVNAELLSESTRRVRDEEVRELADEAFRAAQELLRTHRPSWTSSPARCWPTRCWSASEIDRIMAGTRSRRPTAVPASTSASPPRPPSRPARPPPRPAESTACASPAARRPAAPAPSRPICSAAPCCPRSTTSASPSRASTTRSRSTATSSACRSSTARRSTSRASTRRCSMSATATSSCSSRSGPETAVGQVPERRGPGLHHVAYRVDVGAGDAGRLRRRRHAPDRRGAADRDPRLAGGLPSPRLHRRGPHRDRAARGGA